MEKNKEYSNGEITVVWKPEICIHSASCVKNLPGVFKPTESPWIQLDNSTTAAITNAVNKCPSGALTYRSSSDKGLEDNISQTKAVTKIDVIENGPLRVHGSVIIKHVDGREEERTKVTSFCRCGRTKNGPFCDGTHKK